MHEGEIGKSRARALICWPVNQCSLEDLVNISWLSFAFSFLFHLLTHQVCHDFNSLKKQKNKNKNRKKKQQITHTMNTIQLLLSHATVIESYTTAVEISISLNPWECMSIRGRLKTIGQIHLGCFWELVFITHFVDIWERPTCFESYKCTLFMSVHVGKKKEKKKRLAT